MHLLGNQYFHTRHQKIAGKSSNTFISVLKMHQLSGLSAFDFQQSHFYQSRVMGSVKYVKWKLNPTGKLL